MFHHATKTLLKSRRTSAICTASVALCISPAIAAAGDCIVPTDGMTLTTDALLCPGSYHLPNGLRLDADGITLDGGGAEIFGNGTGNGLSVDNRNNLTVRNLTIRRYYNGLRLRNCDDALIESCTVSDTYNDCLAQPCQFLDIFDDPEGAGNSYGHALWLRYCDRAVVRNNDVSGQQNGISLFNCEEALVEDNQASDNNGWGITLYATNNSVIQRNAADDCLRIGSGHLGGDAAALLMVAGSSNNDILDNSFLRGGDGLFLAGYRFTPLPCANNYFARNDCSDSPNNGFEATFSYGNVFEDNVSDRCNYGYWLGYSWNSTVRGNQANDCFTAAIAIEHGNYNVLENNTLLGNTRAIWLWTDPDPDLVAVFPSLANSHHYTITGNVISGGTYGIICEATGAGRVSYTHTIEGNSIDDSAYGIRFQTNLGSTLRSNFIRNCASAGLSFVTGATNNTIYNNYLSNTPNATALTNNAWSIAPTAGTNIVGGPFLAGNFWSDYNGQDTNSDGIGDTDLPYTSGGGIQTGGDSRPLVFDDPDCNLNGMPDATEPDCNTNGRPDACDIADGLVPDCNANGVPDGCDASGGAGPDVNSDGIPDECQDCNANGTPDPQEIATGTAPDCNANGRPDGCDLAAGDAADCDGNNRLDECDIAAGVPDCNTNGIPDGCEGEFAAGLLGAYYDNLDFAGPPRYRVDPQIDFLFGVTAPWPGFGADTFSIRWTGLIRTPPTTGTYTFYTFTDDGVRLWINGRRLLDQWVNQGATELSATVSLQGNTLYSVVMEYYENGYGAVANLSWRPPGDVKDIVPAANLVPDRDCNGNGSLDRCDVAAGTAPDCNGNGVPDACDIADGISQDADTNGVPDECADCNSNGLADWLDLENGTSQDCNGNQTPDECEPDCNGNTVPDDCDLVPLLAFDDPDSYLGLGGSIWLAVADLGTDGAPEIAVATGSTSEALVILQNDGNGAFPTQTTASTPASQHGVVLEDFDGDGLRDIALAENVNRVIRVLHNNGNGTFTQMHTSSASADPVCVTATDMDGDDDADLVVGHWGNFISILRGNGDGTFAAPVTYTVTGVAYVVAVADIDHDQDIDVAVANLTSVGVRRNNGDGTLGPETVYPAGGSAACVVAVDLNGDAIADLAAANENNDLLSILLNNGNGTFAPAVNYPAGARSRFVAAGDFDQDADFDLVTANLNAAQLSVFANNGDGTVQPALALSVPVSASVVAAGRLDPNGSADLVANRSSGGLTVVLSASSSVSPDCNDNRLPDECDLAAGTSRDVNDNDVPDECELLGNCDADQDVDLPDVETFAGCMGGPDSALDPGCSCADADADGDADLADFASVQVSYTGGSP